MIKQHMIQNGGDKLLLECENAAKENIELTDAQKTKCVNLIADYGVSLYGHSPNSHEYRLLALAAV